jgi:hypothetical protein
MSKERNELLDIDLSDLAIEDIKLSLKDNR